MTYLLASVYVSTAVAVLKKKVILKLIPKDDLIKKGNQHISGRNVKSKIPDRKCNKCGKNETRLNKLDTINSIIVRLMESRSTMEFKEELLREQEDREVWIPDGSTNYYLCYDCDLERRKRRKEIADGEIM